MKNTIQHSSQRSSQHGLRLSPKRISAYVYGARTGMKLRVVLGYTLLELMVVVGIAAVIMAVGAPSVTGMINNNAQTNSANLLTSAINSARASAVTRKRQVFLESIGGSSDWSEGVNIKLGLITNDPELVTNFDSENEIVVKSTTGQAFLVFDQLGRVTPRNSSFEVCNQNTGRAIVINVNYFGNPVISRDGENNLLYSNC